MSDRIAELEAINASLLAVLKLARDHVNPSRVPQHSNNYIYNILDAAIRAVEEKP
jgi:hypothetical protein